jgi:hypothetical protein
MRYRDSRSSNVRCKYMSLLSFLLCFSHSCEDRLELAKVGRADASHGVPSFGSVEPRRPTSWVIPGRNIIKPTDGLAVDHWVQESQRRQFLLQPRIVEQRDETVEGGARSRSSTDGDWGALEEDTEVVGLGGDVWVCATVGIEETFVGLTEALEERRDSFLLVGWAGEVVAKSAAREVDSDFRNMSGSANGSDTRKTINTMHEVFKM